MSALNTRRFLDHRLVFIGGLSVIMVTTFLLSSAQAELAKEARFALVIGNSSYKDAPLKNPKNDAALMERTLQDLGFHVTKHLDLNRRQMTRALARFEKSLPEGSVACVFYAGHGLQVDGQNYLVPTGAEINAKWEVEHETIEQHRVIDMMRNSGSRIRMLILDCCLNNPFDRSWRSTRNLAENRMAPPPVAPSGTIILYSTGEGQTAADGIGENSPFTKAVAGAFSQRPADGLLLTSAIARVGNEMERRFGKDQKPHMTVDTSALTFKLLTGPTEPVSLKTTDSPALKKAVLDLANKPAAQPQSQLPDPLPPPGRKGTAESLIDDSLLAQAGAYATAGKYDLAIESYKAILDTPQLDDATRRRVRLGRGSAYLRRGKAEDWQRALIDYKAGGEPGMPLIIRQKRVEMREGSEVRGAARLDQVALVTHVKFHNDLTWFYIKSVDRDDSMRGWVTAKAFQKEDLKSTPTPTSTAKSSDSQPRLSSSSRPSHEAPASQSRQFSNGNFHNGQQYSSFGSGNSGSNNYRSSNSGNSFYNGINQTLDPAKTQRRTSWTRDFQRRTGRLPTVMETPWWENGREIQSNLNARNNNNSFNRSNSQWGGNNSFFGQQRSSGMNSGGPMWRSQNNSNRWRRGN